MAFDLGFNYRGTAPYVTDGAEGVPVLNETYPHTYTNGNGYSINAGWDSAITAGNFSSGNDPRIAGANYYANTNNVVRTFSVDLSSGSAPGAGTYTVDLAFGVSGGFGGSKNDFKLLDNTTVLIDGTNGGAGYVRADDHFVDATLADVIATTSWTGTTVSKTFATTTAAVGIDYDFISGYTALAHFRLTLQAAGGAVRRRLTMLGVGS